MSKGNLLALASHRIYADFQKLDSAGRLVLTAAGSLRDIATLGENLRDHLSVIFYADDLNDEDAPDDLEVEGYLLYDSENGYWLGTYNPDGFRHASDFR